MTRVVYKYPMNESGVMVVPHGKVVLVAQQDGWTLPVVWVEHNRYEEYRMALHNYATGDKIDVRHTHVGSAVCGSLVWHIYMGG